MQQRVLAVIGGSGLYSAQNLKDAKELSVKIPWGDPSGPIISGLMNGVRILFLARHGKGHHLAPNEINYRANIDALKRSGATDIVSISACGSFREELPPGAFVVVDQFIDRTTDRAKSFFGNGFVAHVSMADPVCPALHQALVQSCVAIDVLHQDGGTYLCIDGPQFSSRAESNLYRSWNCDVIGMTNLPEAKLAREAELPYASVAMVTDYDCWREDDKAVEVADVLETMRSNTIAAGRLLDDITKRLGSSREPSPLGIETGLDYAVITAPEARDPAMMGKLDAVAGRYLNNSQTT